MVQLDLLGFKDNLRTRQSAGGPQVFDPVRGKWVALTPEEMVRQLFLTYCLDSEICPPGLIAVERAVRLYGLEKRYDIAMFDKAGAPQMLVECKAPNVRLGQEALEQVARYNIAMQVPFLVITNGATTFACMIHPLEGTWEELDHIPRITPTGISQP